MSNLDELRQSINDIDSQILTLLISRSEISREVAKYKQEHNMEIFQPQREIELLDNKINCLPIELNLYSQDIKLIYQNIMDFSKKVQQKELNLI